MANGNLMKVESGSILQYFWPALSDDLSWKPFFLFVIFLRVAFYTG